MNQPPLNPDAVDRVAKALMDDAGYTWGNATEKFRDGFRHHARIALAAALPEVTGEQVNLAGWTCNGIHEPGDYSTCEECRDACDDLARFYNHMMRNPRPFKHWTGHPEVKP